MRSELITERDDLVIRRLILEPGESMDWHTDACRRFTVVVHGERLAIEYRDDGSLHTFDLSSGDVGWDEPEPRVHRAVNVGSSRYEEVVTFFREGAHIDPQPRAGVAEPQAPRATP